MTHRFNPSSLREYDIRGIVGETLGEADAYAIGRGFGTRVRRNGGTRVAVGYDGRVSSISLEGQLVRGLRETGIDVVRVGLGPTPMLYYAEATLEVDGGVQVTGSHNPGEYNGFKMVLAHAPFYGADIRDLDRLGEAADWETGDGAVSDYVIIDDYVARLVEGYDAKKPDGSPFRIGWDAGNGAAGEVIEKLVALLPGEHFTLFTDIDGNFPNHHPDPTEEKNLSDLKKLVADNKLDFGLAFDGDGDRLGIVTKQGNNIYPDRQMVLFARDVLSRVPGGTILFDVKCSQRLAPDIEAAGGVPLMYKTGHSLIKAKMKEVNSPLGGEMSGHIFFKERWYGFDDGTYAGARLLAIVPRERLVRMLRRVLDESEFLSPHGLRSLSQAHRDAPCVLEVGGERFTIGYEPAESGTGLFGGNSNWRGPVWFPLNHLLIEALRIHHEFYGDTLTVELPVGSGHMATLGEVSDELARRLAGLFLPGPDGKRPCHGDDPRYADDPHWRDLLLFHEYFDGNDGRGLGASHQTGWTALAVEYLGGRPG